MLQTKEGQLECSLPTATCTQDEWVKLRNFIILLYIALTKTVMCYKVKRSASLSLSLFHSPSPFPSIHPSLSLSISLSLSFSLSLSLTHKTDYSSQLSISDYSHAALGKFISDGIPCFEPINQLLPACTVYLTNYVYFWIQYTHIVYVHTRTHALRTRQSRSVYVSCVQCLL